MEMFMFLLSVNYINLQGEVFTVQTWSHNFTIILQKEYLVNVVYRHARYVSV